MKPIITFIAALIFCPLFVCPVQAQQSVFSESFSSRDLSRWSGDTAHFGFEQRSGNILLQLNADSAGSSYLSAPAGDPYGKWDIYIEMDLSPSANNNNLIYLLSDREDLLNAPNGYAMQLGENGSDDRIRLFRMESGSKTAEIVTGNRNISMGAPIRIQVIRDRDGWQLFSSASYDLIPEADGTGSDNIFQEAGWFGFISKYTSSNTDAFYYDFEITPEPIKITGWGQPSADQLYLSTNIPVQTEQLSPTSFTLDPGSLSPGSVGSVSSDTVVLRFPEPLTSGNKQLHVQDLIGINGTSLADTLLLLIVFDPLQPGDLQISEFMKDPPSGIPEYLELFNNSNKYLDISGLILADDRSLRSFASDHPVALAPQEFVVFTSDTLSLIQAFGPGNFAEVSLPSLNNGGDQIRIFSPGGTLIDSLAYNSDWGGSDVALERRSYEAPSFYAENWADSEDQNGGTPGRANQLAPDTEAPEIQYLQYLSERSLIVYFNERINSNLQEIDLNLEPSLIIDDLSVINNTLTIYIQGAFKDRETYTLTLFGLSDIFGNKMETRSESARYLRLSGAKQGAVIINEFYPGSAESEFIELFNNSELNLDLDGWEILNGNQEKVTLPPRSFMAPSEYVVIGNPYSSNPTVSLRSGSDMIIIKDTDGLTIDSLFYNDRWPDGDGERSYERSDPDAASSDPSKWILSISENGNTAGSLNSVFSPDEFAPQVLLARRISSERLEILFDEYIKPPEQVSIGAQVISVNLPSESTDLITVITPPEEERLSETLTITGLPDHKGNTANELTTQIVQSLQYGDLVINEIMFDPLQDPDDNIPDQREYLEIFNRQDFPVTLQDLFIHHQPDEDEDIDAWMLSNSWKLFAPARDYFLIHAEPDGISLGESSLGRYFELDENRNSAIISRSSLGLSSDEDQIYISHPEIGTLDSLFYTSEWHNPNLFNTKGVSLERISPDQPGNESSNWSSNVTASGGSPLQQNSIHQESGAPGNRSGLSITPNPFSPDADGHEDHTFINYDLKQSGTLLRVRIFDRFGRFIRELEQLQPAGSTGSVIWDGRDQQGRKNRLGLYIILFESLDPAGGRVVSMKTTVAIAG